MQPTLAVITVWWIFRNISKWVWEIQLQKLEKNRFQPRSKTGLLEKNVENQI